MLNLIHFIASQYSTTKISINITGLQEAISNPAIVKVHTPLNWLCAEFL